MLDGKKSHVKKCEENYPNRKDFSIFREDWSTYHILLCNCDLDPEALELARKINPGLYQEYLKKDKPKLGYGEDPSVPYREMDMCDSHHIMMSTIISNYKKKWGKIIEIGAGYGNMIRLNQGILEYDEWIDIDLPFVLDLAKWYLGELGIKITYQSAYKVENQESELVIGAHSVSELSWEDFIDYYQKIIGRAKYFFYASHINNSGEELLKMKWDLIEKDFEIVSEVISEGGGVRNTLYKIK